LYEDHSDRESDTSAAPCRICGNDAGNRAFTAMEMMLGTRDRFGYQECGRCGALQIREIPADLAPYYAPPYYSFEPPRPVPPLKRWLKRRLARHLFGRLDPLGALLARARRPRELEWVRTAGLGPDAAILDVGAGSGDLLLSLRDYGFRRLLGVDPFLGHDLDHGNGVRVLATGLDAVADRFDLVMFHHSYEHVADPAATLAEARRRLTERGRILIRMPVAAESWRTYGADWAELDAPRHLHVHTAASLDVLARGAGLEVTTVRYDTDAFELWGSEQYRRDIPLADPRSHGVHGAGQVFTSQEMRAFQLRADALNRTGRAGRAAFWLAPTRAP
jgi:SAM-dependent methyltransferase